MLPCSLVALVAVPSAATELTGYGVLTTDYVYRGVSYSDEGPALQGALDLSFDSGAYLGAWGSSVDIDNGPDRQRDLQFNYYLGFGKAWRNDWLLGANVVAYTFPGTRGNVDYDYVEYSLLANYADRAWIEYSYSPNLFDSGRHTHNVELYAEWPLPENLMLGVGAGYYDTSAFRGDGYGYWQLGLTRPFGPVDLDLRFHDASRAVPVISTPSTAGSRLVLSVKLPF